MAKLKIASTWSGDLQVELEQWTVPMLREEVAKQSSMLPETINLICAGKVLKDGDGSEKLSQLGIKNNAKILATRVSADEGKSLVAEEERSRRLTRVKAMMMGLMLHANAKKLIRRQLYKDALEVLTMGETIHEKHEMVDCDVDVTFDCFHLLNFNPLMNLITWLCFQLVDNIPLLQIDMVWCYFMLRDISWLSVAGMHLQKAREGIERAHGKDSFRMRLLQAGRHPELALHLRMELLEGVVAYHSGQFDKSRKALTSAQAKFFQIFSAANFNLKYLLRLRLDGNHFIGKTPQCLCNSFDLAGLYLSDNHLYGRIPNWLGNMSELVDLIMPNNHLQGPFPPEFCQLQNLQVLNLAENNISGNLPSCFNPPQIQQVHLSRNKLHGQLKDAFFNSSSLVTLDLGYNRFKGRILNWIGQLSKLTYLIFTHNNLEGEVPHLLCHLEQLCLKCHIYCAIWNNYA
ncbi:hypothetical protein LWI29_008417 [Acer saccharum]|uniref:Ubiquitin-like domain-containing protein n=1 Tax=Acer saccharum TaxID=4024 RepID=A0AA39RCB1_ACESA|nr:hypothetical protein LWI29_008417 [Acer saccharum]